ncbi:MAG: PP2C family protein-serine/threonine phosphatase [Candidatus Omnitrophota bacterium]
MLRLLSVRKPIPEEYRAEYQAKLSLLIKSRTRLLCVLAVGMYLAITALSFLIYPDDFSPAELPVCAVLIAGAAVLLYLNRRAGSIRSTKLNAYLFTVFFLAIVSYLFVIYADYADSSSTAYLFTLFLVVFTIPWEPWETVPITLLHLQAFTFLHFYIIKKYPDLAYGPQDWYTDGVILLVMGFVLCLVIRRKEAMRDIENFVLMKRLEEKNDQMRRELELATRIQKTLIPRSFSGEIADIVVTYLPVYYIGGDYARFRFLDKEKLVFIICDVTGHGVSAALLVNRLHAEFERLVKEEKEPGLLLKELNTFISEELKGLAMYLSAFCGLLDFTNGKLLYSNHGHPDQYMYRVSSSSIEKMSSLTGLIGLPFLDEGVYQHELRVGRGDRILLFTDGVTETRNARNEDFGDERLEEFIKKYHTLPAEVFSAQLKDELDAFRSGDITDDIFLLNIHVK